MATKSSTETTMNENQAEKAAKVLFAFPSFRAKQKLPAKLQLSKLHKKRLLKWKNMALDNLKRPKVSGTSSESVGASDANDNLDSDVVNQKKGTPTEIAASCPSDSSDENEDDCGFEFINKFNKMMEDIIGSIELQDGQSISEMKNNLNSIIQKMRPVIQSMASKELEYQKCKAIRDFLVQWMEENKGTLTPEAVELREKQLCLLNQIVVKYEELKNDEDIKDNDEREKQVWELIKQLNESGDLPEEIKEAEQELTEMEKFLDILPEKMEEMLNSVMAMFDGLASLEDGTKDDDDDDDDDCSIM